jgi:hypothetical protein
MMLETTTDGRLVQRAAFVFYTVAAVGSSIGQVWVGVVTPPWPPAVPWWLRAILVLPFAVVLDLGGVVTAAFADWRQRKGEHAVSWRILSATWIAIGVGINIVGHADTPYLAVVFGSLGTFAYTVWLLHAASRRRDALRTAGKLDDTAPKYGLRQWRREPDITARARSLAIEHGHSRLQSLHIARRQLHDEQRDQALQQLLLRHIKAQHNDTVLASIGAATAPIEALAAQLTARFDSAAWIDYLAGYLQPPALQAEHRRRYAPAHPSHSTPITGAADQHHNQEEDGLDETDDHSLSPNPAPENPVAGEARGSHLPSPVTDARLRRWRAIWQKLAGLPTDELTAFAQANDVSVRTLQRIRQAGEAGRLDDTEPATNA